MRWFESPEQRERREADEERIRKDRNAAFEASEARRAAEEDRRRESLRGREEREAQFLAGHPWAQLGRRPDHSAEAKAARAEASARAGEAEGERQADLRSWRAQVDQALREAGSAAERAKADRDLDAFAEAHSRQAAMRTLLADLDRAEEERQRQVRQPFFAGAGSV